MVWPDFKFGAPTFNELTFDHWLVVEAVRVPLDEVCLTGPYIWQADLSAPFAQAVDLTAAFSWQVAVSGALAEQLDLMADFGWQVNLSAEFKC